MNNLKYHSVKYNLVMNIILKISSFIFPMISFPYVSRVLLAEGNGKVAFATAIISYFTLFGSLGIPTYGVKACAKVREQQNLLEKTVKEILIINIACSLISYLCFSVLMFTVEAFQVRSNILWVCSASIILNAIGVEWFYQAIEQYDYITFRNILFKFLSLLLMFLLVHRPEDYIIYGGITVIGTVGSNVLNVIRLHKYVDLKHKFHLEFKKHMMPILVLFLYLAATTIYTNLDSVMLGLMAGDDEVGYYNAAVKLKNVLVSVVTALGTVLLPRISYYLSQNKEDLFISILKKSVSYILLLALPIAVYFYIEAEPAIVFLASELYQPAIPALKVIMPTIVVIGFSSITAWQILIPSGKEKWTVIAALTGGIIDFILNAALIPRYGATGAAVGTLFAEVSVLAVHCFCLKGLIQQIIPAKNLIKIVIACIISAIGLMICSASINSQIAIIQLIFSSIIFFAIYGLVILALKEEIFMQYGMPIINKIKKKAVRK